MIQLWGNIPRARSVPSVGWVSSSSPCLPHRASGASPAWGKGSSSSSSAGLSLCPAQSGQNSWQFQPGLAAHPAVPGCGRGSSSLTHGSCTLGQILGCGSPQEPAIPSSAFPGHWGWLVPAQPALAQGKWCQGLRERQAGAQLSLGKRICLLSAASLSSVPGRTLRLVPPSHSHHQGHPATPLGCPQGAPGWGWGWACPD